MLRPTRGGPIETIAMTTSAWRVRLVDGPKSISLDLVAC